jgi:hypothetical protein
MCLPLAPKRCVVRIAVDFDNTIVDYGGVFAQTAAAAGYLGRDFAGDKQAVRDALRALPEGEERWQRVQAAVYGPGLAGARPYPGAAEFVRRCRNCGIGVFVVSHRLRFAAAAPDGPDLRDAAASWLQREFGHDAFDGVYFEGTRRDKIERIVWLRCTHVVDDLVEVFDDAAFPATVVPWLFDPYDRHAGGGIERFTSWEALTVRVLDEQRVWAAVQALLGEPVVEWERVKRGGNNRVHRVVAASGRCCALKIYGVPDERSRLAREFAALQFLDRAGTSCVPRPLGRDDGAGIALYEWIDGDAGCPPAPGDVGQALALVERLDALRKLPEAGGLPLAADAAIDLRAFWRDISERLTRLQQAAAADAALSEFLDAFEPVSARIRAQRAHREGRELAHGQRTLSPSDLGFHNAVRRAGRLVFMDFEYFGWDDPVKLAADFVYHPGMALSSADIKEWLEGLARLFSRDADFAARLDELHPVFALKWCLIVLNDLLPSARRRVAWGGGRSCGQARREQLAKAWRLLTWIKRNEPLSRFLG